MPLKPETVVISGRIPKSMLPQVNRYLKKKKLYKADLVSRAVISLILNEELTATKRESVR